MASADTAQPLALSSSPPPLDRSPSNLSSPLSDVEDKDGDGNSMDVDIQITTMKHVQTQREEHNGLGEEGASSSDSDELSEADVNDSEAETERLYNTPPKSNGTHDIVVNGAAVTRNQFTDRRDRTFERSPSKLQQQVKPDPVENAVSDDDSLSDPENEDDDDDVSLPPSDDDTNPSDERLPRSPSIKKTVEGAIDAEPVPEKNARQASCESRKRKRPTPAADSEADQPLRKRTGSVVAPETDIETAIIDDEAISTNIHSAERPGADDIREAALGKRSKPEEPALSIEREVVEQIRPKKSKRVAARNRPSPDQGGEDVLNDVQNGLHAVNNPAEDEAVEAELDEEAEAAHKEEELERKKSAWEELAAIERQFSNFRERLYQERLEQLEKEEAMLMGPNPTHPEYLAMLQCVEERRNERIRLAAVEQQLKMDVLKNRAVAERAQILCQFFQDVRQLREDVLEELGKDWYAIQYERRRQANNIPDFGIRYPITRAQNVKNAVAYNREVSILSGFAKHVGFPAAPSLGGASDDQLDSDFEAIQRAREVPVEPALQHQPTSFHRELSGSLPFGRIGAAGELFIEQTPWANPNHPLHNLQRSTQQGPENTPSAAGPSTGRRKQARQAVEQSSYSNALLTVVNGAATTEASFESLKSSSKAAHDVLKRDAVATAS